MSERSTIWFDIVRDVVLLVSVIVDAVEHSPSKLSLFFGALFAAMLANDIHHLNKLPSPKDRD